MVTQTVDITRALAIPGWMAEPELVWLAQRAGEHRCIVEIGSHLGRSTRAMLDHTDGIVYAFDDWRGPRDVYLSKEEREGLLAKFLRNVLDKYDDLMYSEKLVFCKGDFADTYKEWGSGLSPDMVFIDGSHEYEDVKRDVQFWKDKIVPGGLLCGHDAGTFEGVTRAVVELLGEDVEVVKGTSIWWVKV